MQTTVSVIIPTYNRKHTLGRALDSVMAQQYGVTETIVIDDGSTDNTVEWVEENYPSVIVLSQPNTGVSTARNIGIARASGQWIALLDSDDYWYPQKIDQQLHTLQQNEHIRLCHSDEHWIRNGTRVNQMNKHRKTGGWVFQQCLPLCAISPSASLIKKTVFDDLGGFDETLPACEDYDYWLRLCSREPVAYIDTALIQKYGGHDDQLSNQHWGMDRFRLEAIAKLVRNHLLKPFMQNADYIAAVQMFNTKLSIYCKGALKRNRDEHVAELRHRYDDILSLSL
jgi:glycosyltransferase involved in cell wall biosynthesis